MHLYMTAVQADGKVTPATGQCNMQRPEIVIVSPKGRRTKSTQDNSAADGSKIHVARKLLLRALGKLGA